MSIEGQGHFLTIYFLGFVCFVLYQAKISGERLQDHWSSVFLFFFKYVKWLPVYHVSTIFGNHVTAGVLWVKVTFLLACQQTKWRPDRTKFDGEIVSQTPCFNPHEYFI